MREVLVRWRYAVACMVLLSVVVAADARDAAPARTPVTDGGARVAAAVRETVEHARSRIIRWIVRLSDELTGPRP